MDWTMDSGSEDYLLRCWNVKCRPERLWRPDVDPIRRIQYPQNAPTRHPTRKPPLPARVLTEDRPCSPTRRHRQNPTATGRSRRRHGQRVLSRYRYRLGLPA